MRITEKKQIQRFYQALLNRESSYVGIFYVGVKTTSIFCIATCRARKPKLENVEFYTTLKTVQSAGYRPCKVCKPTKNAEETPAQVRAAIQLFKNNPRIKISDQRLIDENIRPEFVRRWFKQTHGMTFHAYQRMHRINDALQEVKDGKTATDIAFDTGYESLSGFAYTFKKILGKSPKNSKEDNILLVSRLTTPIGPMLICTSERGICLLEFTDRRRLKTEFEDLQYLLKAKVIAGENQYSRQTEHEVGEYFAGKRTQFDVSIDAPGTPFQTSVWRGLQQIPFGELSTYQQQANALKKPKAVRALARANGANRIAIIIPCHRVIGKNGELIGYGGGLERKRWLIEHERGLKKRH